MCFQQSLKYPVFYQTHGSWELVRDLIRGPATSNDLLVRGTTHDSAADERR